MDDGNRGLTLMNTMTRQRELLRPLDFADPAIPEAEKRVRMYVCGPTVYDFAHIGNARPVIVFDVLFRLLRHLYGADRVRYARNVTDVDDKINARAARDYPGLDLNAAIAKVTEATAAQFHKDVAALGCLPPDIEPRATDHIGEMRTMIERLVRSGHAYVADDHVLFSTPSMPDYGALSRRPLDEMIVGARVEVAGYKRHPTDFVLWKPSEDGEPGWPSPAGIEGLGRPGWHIECSAMSEKHLGPVFDIHGGGLDLIFPHHENEIAQSRCAHGTQAMAQIWMHNGFVQVEGRKMSKSEGNFVTIADLLETTAVGGRRWPGEVVRLAMLMTHYREPLDFSERRLIEAESIRERLYGVAASVRRSDYDDEDGRLRSGSLATLDEENPPSELKPFLLRDLDTPGYVKKLQEMAAQYRKGDEMAGRLMMAGAAAIGISLREFETDLEYAEAIRGGVEYQIAERRKALAARDFESADRIRDELAGMHVQLKDGKDPHTGERVTTWEIKR